MAGLGVIGGSGVYTLQELQSSKLVEVDTPFGLPSAPIRHGSIGNSEVYFLPRHGLGHTLSPTNVPYRANIYALKQLGVTHLLSFSAVGSLRADLPPRTLIIPDQIIDRTLLRERTFFDREVVAHVSIADPYCSLFQGAIASAAATANREVVAGGTYVCIEGPQFSTRAESNLYRSWGASVIGMTTMPEARLAREAELCFATLAMVTDYDVWNESEADVSVEVVLSHVRANSEAAAAILLKIAENGLPERSCTCKSALDDAFMTEPGAVSAVSRERLRLLIGDRLAGP
jgi:5'-methylthioadenosine phosphorylase